MVVEIVFRGAPGCFWGTYVYIGGRSTSVAARGDHETGGALQGGRSLLSRGGLGCFLTCTPSPLDHVHSKNHAPGGFIPFGLRLILFFLRNTEIGKKNNNLGWASGK